MKASLLNRLRATALGLTLAFSAHANAARLALVIGNDAYQHVSPLRNAVADAQTMAEAFRKAGYQVTQSTNRDLKSMKDDLRAFRRRVQGGDEVVLFFSGHGVQLGGENFLLPIDVRSDGEDQVRDDAVGLSAVLADIRSAKPLFTLAIVDACRDNPFAQAGRSIGGRGLTRAASATGEMILFAAGEGQKALDRLSDNDPVRNGVFTRVFVKEMERPGLPVDQVMKNVRVEVARLAQSVRHEQVPALYDQVLGTFYFYRGSEAPPPSPPAGPTAEQQTWARVQASNTAAGYRAYINAYPQGQYLADARVALALVEAVSAPTVPPALPAAPPSDRPLVQPQRPATASGVQPPSPAATFKDCDVCPEMVWVPEGSFKMGDSGDNAYDEYSVPARMVKVNRFSIGRFEVTQGQWKALMGTNPSKFKDCGDDCPVENVKLHDDALEFIARLNKRTGKTYRLPSEAEWEYAARAGATLQWPHGDEADPAALAAVAWYDRSAGGKTHPVGQKKPNAFGLYDMLGNVAEWVADCWHPNYRAAPRDGRVWSTGCSDTVWHIARGGGWNSWASVARHARRGRIEPGVPYPSIGLRVVREP